MEYAAGGELFHRITTRGAFSEDEINENVAREILNHRSIQHPNIVRFKEVVVLTPTYLAIVMEYAVGGELFHQITTRGAFSEDEGRARCWFPRSSFISLAMSIKDPQKVKLFIMSRLEYGSSLSITRKRREMRK